VNVLFSDPLKKSCLKSITNPHRCWELCPRSQRTKMLWQLATWNSEGLHDLGRDS